MKNCAAAFKTPYLKLIHSREVCLWREIENELRHRVALAAAAFSQQARPLFLQRSVQLHTRAQVYNCMVLSVLVYGSEAWALTDAQLKGLEVFHRSRLRRLLGVRLSDGLSNMALYARCGSRSLKDMLEGRQLRWQGHLRRMPDERLAKHMLYSTVVARGARHVGCQAPRLRERYMQLARTRMSCAGLSRSAQRSWYLTCKDKAAWNAVCSAR